jgi:hypothetical protein
MQASVQWLSLYTVRFLRDFAVNKSNSYPFAMLHRYLLGLLLITSSVPSFAQISHGGEPISYSLPLLPPLRPTGFNAQEVADEDMVNDALGRPPRFSVLLPEGYNVQNSGEWTTVKGSRIRRLRIETRLGSASW